VPDEELAPIGLLSDLLDFDSIDESMLKRIDEWRISTLPLSARNHLKGEITEVLLGTVTALITVKVGDNLIESVITKRSAEEMSLKTGDKVIAVIKATEVMIQKD
jgi:molybdopterin-binding protein